MFYIPLHVLRRLQFLVIPQCESTRTFSAQIILVYTSRFFLPEKFNIFSQQPTENNKSYQRGLGESHEPGMFTISAMNGTHSVTNVACYFEGFCVE